jgi:hypothetical protein
MSDYLSNLAARSFNPTQVIQPRVAARFEPPSESERLDPAPDHAVEPLDVQPPDELAFGAPTSLQPPGSLAIGRSPQWPSPTATPQSPFRTAHPSSSDVDAAPDRQHQPQPEMQSPPTFDNSVIAPPGPEHERSLASTRELDLEQKSVPNPRGPATPWSSAPATPQTPLQPPDGSLPSPPDVDRPPLVPFNSDYASEAIPPRNAATQPRRGARPPANAHHGVEADIVSAEPWLPAHHDEPEAVEHREATGLTNRPNPAVQGVRIEPRPAAEEAPFLPLVPPEPTPVQIIRPASAVTVIVPPHLTTPVASSAPAAPAAPPTPVPEIRVTIGRIEVHALMPPAPPAQRSKPPRSAPLLSLDDYLKQRQEGRR